MAAIQVIFSNRLHTAIAAMVVGVLQTIIALVLAIHAYALPAPPVSMTST